MICVPVTEAGAADFLAAIGRAAVEADAVELRFDLLDEGELGRVLDELPGVIEGLDAKIIFTFRPGEQGGGRDLTLTERRRFWESLAPELRARLDYADLEADLVESYAGQVPPVPWGRVICSEHDFLHTPADPGAIYDRLSATPARVVKIATRAEKITDCVRLFDLMDRAGNRPVIALGMGMAGMATRVLGVSRGAFLTFAALAPGAESAPGQPTIEEMRDLYRVGELSRESEIYGVIGYPVGHSRSPMLHNSAFRAAGRDAVYLPFEVADLGEFIKLMVNPRTRGMEWNLRGLSVTIPHKTAIRGYLDRVDEAADCIGAVNTVVIEGDELVGYNTDAIGAMRPLEGMVELKGADAAVIGAGGAARAVVYGLSERGARVRVYARDAARAASLAAEFGCSGAGIGEFDGRADVVINCTPVGMKGHSEGGSPVAVEKLSGAGLVYDLVYNPEETELLKQARACGCRTLGGLPMLAAQAAEQYRLWTGER
ncbi:MAG: shikimate dehydrogenase [Blastocatellales bacterium]|nr:shikimate dehydrogenase [Blastocatellales bacterium]